MGKEEAAAALYNLSIHPAHRPELMTAGVHISLSALLRDQDATPVAKEYAAKVLRYLSIDPAHHPALMEAGVHISLRDLLNNPAATPWAKQQANQTLANLEQTERCCTIS